MAPVIVTHDPKVIGVETAALAIQDLACRVLSTC